MSEFGATTSVTTMYCNSKASLNIAICQYSPCWLPSVSTFTDVSGWCLSVLWPFILTWRRLKRCFLRGFHHLREKKKTCLCDISRNGVSGNFNTSKWSTSWQEKWNGHLFKLIKVWLNPCSFKDTIMQGWRTWKRFFIMRSKIAIWITGVSNSLEFHINAVLRLQNS